VTEIRRQNTYPIRPDPGGKARPGASGVDPSVETEKPKAMACRTLPFDWQDNTDGFFLIYMTFDWNCRIPLQQPGASVRGELVVVLSNPMAALCHHPLYALAGRVFTTRPGYPGCL
jgi:hypothetical protein